MIHSLINAIKRQFHRFLAKCYYRDSNSILLCDAINYYVKHNESLPDSDLNTIQSSCYEAIYEYVLGCNSTSIKEKFKVDCVVDALNNEQKIELINAAGQVADLIHISGLPPLKAVEEAIKSNQIKRVLI